VAYTSSGFVRRMNDARNRDTNSKKHVDTREWEVVAPRGGTTEDVGAWRRIGGGQGALSRAYKETGVACIPGKQPDYSGLSERKQCSEAHVIALEPWGWNGPSRKQRKLRKARPDPSYQKRTQRWVKLDGRGSLALVVGSQGVLIRLTKTMTLSRRWESGVTCIPE